MKVVESYRVRIRGTRPLLMHSPASLLNDGKGKRSSAKPDPRTEAEKALYRDPNGKICVPAYVIKATIREAAKDYKVPGRGKKTFRDFVRAGILVEPEYIPLKTNGDPEKAWKIDLRPVVVQKSRILRARPRFDEWELEFTVHIVDPIIRGENLREFLETAGRFYGICDFRPEFGLFEVVEFEKIRGADES